MNSLDSLLKVCHQLPNKDVIVAYEAKRFRLRTPKGKQIADVGCKPILHMRHFQVTLVFPHLVTTSFHFAKQLWTYQSSTGWQCF